MIYYVEDDASIRNLVVYTLTMTGFPSKGFERSAPFWAEMDREKADLILLDLMLPGENGLSVLRELKTRRDTMGTPVILITAKDGEDDVVQGLELGADDYIAKPFDMKELVARIKAVSRRFQAADAPEKELVFPGLTININQYRVMYMGKELEMPPKELELLYFLASHPGMVFTREQLLEQVWGYDYFGDSRTVDVHVKRLREKLTEGEKLGWQIKTVWGVGYKFEVK